MEKMLKIFKFKISKDEIEALEVIKNNGFNVSNFLRKCILILSEEPSIYDYDYEQLKLKIREDFKLIMAQKGEVPLQFNDALTLVGILQPGDFRRQNK